MRWMMMLALVGLIGCSQKIDASSPEFRQEVLKVVTSSSEVLGLIAGSSPTFRKQVLGVLMAEEAGVDVRGLRVVDDSGELRAQLTTADVPGLTTRPNFKPPPSGVLRLYNEDGDPTIKIGYVWRATFSGISTWPAAINFWAKNPDEDEHLNNGIVDNLRYPKGHRRPAWIDDL